MELNKAIEIMLSANNGDSIIGITEFVEATDVVLDAMRNEITTSEMIKWCYRHRKSVENNRG